MTGRHFHRATWVVTLAFGLAACISTTRPGPQTEVDLAAQTVRGDKPAGPTGACWTKDETPAVIETITEQIAVTATVDRDAGYRTQTQQILVQPREQIWFRTPCDIDLPPEVIATLQRALAARGLYLGEPTGAIDADTRAAIRAYQTPRGLNSDRLSLAAARELGVVAADFGQSPAG